MSEHLSILQEGLPDLPEDLFEPAEVESGWPWWVMAVVVVAMLAALAAGWRWWRRWMDRRAASGEGSPRREAEQGLQSLRRAGDRLTTAAWAVALSAVVRSYVDRIWQTSLSQQTLEEQHRAEGTGLAALPDDARERLAGFLRDCEGLKFEPVEITQREREELWQRAEHLVRRLPANRPAARETAGAVRP